MRVLYLYGSLSAREMKSQKFDARTNGCLEELISIIDLSLDQMDTIQVIRSHTSCHVCVSGLYLLAPTRSSRSHSVCLLAAVS